MPWLKLLHISAVIVWSGSLLYLTLAIATAATAQPAVAVDTSRHQLLRGLFTQVATPAALVAIASGTVIFLLQGPVVAWLIAKLAVVAMLVLGHAACGMLVLRAERQAEGASPGRTRLLSALVGSASAIWLATIAWLVLDKPF